MNVVNCICMFEGSSLWTWASEVSSIPAHPAPKKGVGLCTARRALSLHFSMAMHDGRNGVEPVTYGVWLVYGQERT